jgi:hypothetical protein
MYRCRNKKQLYFMYNFYLMRLLQEFALLKTLI